MRTEERMLAFIRQYIGAKGFPPTVREIATGLGLGSTSVVAYHLGALERAGRIERMPRVARGLRVVN